MSIDLIIDALKYAIKFCPDQTVDGRCGQTKCEGGCLTTQALAEARKIKPTTITDDPATWPANTENTPIVFWNFNASRKPEPEIKWADYVYMTMKRHDVFTAEYKGCKWQYLPEWEG